MESIFLVKTNICVPVGIFYPDNHVVNDGNTRSVSQELLVSRLTIILFCFYKLVVEVNIIRLTLLYSARCKQSLDKQCV